MTARLYVTSLSNPSKAAIAMVAYKQLPHKVVTLTSGFHPFLVRAAGFQGRTVPALRLDDGRRVQGSLAISRTLDELIAERPLFPADPAARRAVEDAERWGHDELQSVPRRIFRHATVQDPALRRWVAADVAKVPAPAVATTISKPLAARLSRESGGEDLIRADLVRLPGLLDHVDELVGGGVIGAEAPNAADFQILASVRVLLDFQALPDFEQRPGAQAARRLFGEWEGEMPFFDIPGA
jgi:glutathione S-transferase